MRKRRIFSAILSVVLLFNIFAVSAEDNTAFDGAVHAAYYEENGGDLTLGWWDIAALSALGYKAEGFAVERAQNASAATAASNIILDVLTGADTKADIKALNTFLSGGKYGATPNDHIWAVIALNMAGAKFDRAAAALSLINLQLEDGGFAFAGNISDADMTGMALSALAAVRDEGGIAGAIERAVGFLRGAQQESGGFKDLDYPEYSYVGSVNPNSTAAALIGLIDAGEDISGDEWKKNGRTIVDALLDFEAEGGGFYAPFAPGEPNQMATAQALIALGAYEYGKSVFQSVPEAKRVITPKGGPQKTPIPVDGISVSISVFGPRGKLAETPSKYKTTKATAFEALIQFAEEKKLKVDYEESAFGVFIKSIGGQEPEKSSYWAFLANGEFSTAGPGDYALREGDKLVFCYCGFYAYADKEKPNKGAKFNIHVVKIGYDPEKKKQTVSGVSGAEVSYNGVSVKTSDKGVAAFTAAGSKKNAKVVIKKETNADLWEDFEKTIAITPASSSSGGIDKVPKQAYLTVTGDGPVFLARRAVTLEDGDTPITILKRRFPDTIVRGTGSNQYVVSVNGLSEFEYGAESGWKYKLNGEIKNQSAAKYKLKDGDEVEWFYVYKASQDAPWSSGTLLPKSTPAPTPTPTPTPKADGKPMRLSDRKGLDLLAETINAEGFAPAVLGLAGRESNGAREAIQKYVAENGEGFSKVTDIERTVINAVAQGLDPENIDGRDLIIEITEHPNIQKQGLNGVAFGLIALDSASFEDENSREKLIGFLLKQQKSDGGFALSGGKSEIDITAFAVTALAPYRDRKDVGTCVEKALSYINKGKTKAGGYKSAGGEENCESLAWVIIAKCAIGLDPLEEMANLAKYELNDGSFSHTLGGKSDVFATEQALLAVAAYERRAEGRRLFEFDKAEAAPFDLSRARDAADISPWAVEYVDRAIKKGIVKGDDRRRVNPKVNVRRAELAAMLIRAINVQPLDGAEQVFADVKPGDWFYGYVMRCYQMGLVQGYSAELFAPDEYITRQELAAITARMLGITGGDSAPADIHLADDWAKDVISAVFSKGIMVGDGVSFSPREVTTREQAVKIVLEISEIYAGQ